MRSVGHSHPEWGYLAPAPGFMRTVRVVLVATAVGATAGAAVVVSLIERPAADAADSSIATHALVTSAQAATQPTTSAKSLARVKVQGSGESKLSPPAAAADGPAARADAREASTSATQAGFGSVTALSEPPQAADTAPTSAREDAAVGSDASAAPKGKRRQANGNEVRSKPSGRNRGLGSFLSRLFSARGPSNY